MDYLAKLEQADKSVNGTLSKQGTSATMPRVFQRHKFSITIKLLNPDAAARKRVRQTALATLPVSLKQQRCGLPTCINYEPNEAFTTGRKSTSVVCPRCAFCHQHDEFL